MNNWRKLWWTMALTGLLYLSFRAFAWWGLALVVSGIVFWLLLHATRMLRTMERATQQPMGSVVSAVMFQAKLHSGLRLLQVIGQAGSLGQLRTAPEEQPEVFVWRDAAGDEVCCRFQEGRLIDWTLTRASGTEHPMAGA